MRLQELGGSTAYCTSRDEGCTWSKTAVLHDGPHDDRDPSIVQLKSGRLIFNFFSLAGSDDSNKVWIGHGSWIVTSDDLGRTRGRSPTTPGAALSFMSCS